MDGFSVLPSALAYLFGDMLQDQFAGKTRIGFSEKVPCREVKVKKKDLATVMLVAGFAHLRKSGHLRLAVGKRGRIIKSPCIHVTLAAQASGYPGWLEGRILANVSGNLKKDDVRSIVWRLLGADSGDPWTDVIGQAQAYLLDQGYYMEEDRRRLGKLLGKKRVPLCERILGLQQEVGALRAMLSAFRMSESDTYEQLWKDVGKGIASRQEQPDVDYDD